MDLSKQKRMARTSLIVGIVVACIGVVAWYFVSMFLGLPILFVASLFILFFRASSNAFFRIEFNEKLKNRHKK
ncbi:MAG: hypothetical protein LBV63_01300 [Candidatus Methanoplasma sp.]|jgi:Kef-type K+ transport system membrane component KefB|nr:hypothetical protein [Candidatus Methanoplasma sp.]